MFSLYFSLALGGAFGACARYCVTEWIMRAYPGDFEHGTLAVNVIGSLLIGVIFVLIHDKMHLPQSIKPFMMTGFLGSFTTFSTFSLQTLNHITEGQYLHAIVYVVLSVVLCVLACFMGMYVTRLF